MVRHRERIPDSNKGRTKKTTNYYTFKGLPEMSYKSLLSTVAPEEEIPQRGIHRGLPLPIKTLYDELK